MTIGHKISEVREDALREGREEGLVEGNEGTEKIFLALLRNPEATNSEISAITGATDERINKIRDIINQSKA